MYEIHGCSAEVVQHHLTAKENESPTEAAHHNGDAVEYLPESCPACDAHLRNVIDLIAHANSVHEFNGTVQHKLFPSMNAFLVNLYVLFRLNYDEITAEFQRWKKEMEKEHNCRWIQADERTEQLPYHGLLRCQGSVF
ncbi:unnamed protein product [Heligmosomoides polygyrus]|uniref:C2H2-type domain-containing protein n=1 Tax=Heligmosomoides polygyrus TaxID=6339 RepID=A0A183FDY6_HELPZ|nr:unnamed protein product [Heligmosomoides polygyrus]